MKGFSLFLLVCLLSFSVKGQELSQKSKVYLDFVIDDSSVDPSDALDMFKIELEKLTSLVVVSESSKAEFNIKIQVLKSFGDLRKARFDIYENLSGNKIFESKWQKAGSTFKYGMSGTRGAISISIKKQLLKKYPHIRW